MMRRPSFTSILAAALLLAAAHKASAIEVKVSAKALERTLRAQLFNGPEGRYYIRGDITTPCYVYADKPQVSFKDDRIVIHVHTKSRLGAGVRNTCVGVGLDTDADVSVIPEAEGESVGFRDARIERLSASRELSFLLVPFLSRKLPAQMKLNAAEMMRTLLVHAPDSTGYILKLDHLKLHSMLVQDNALVVDVDASIAVD